MTIYYTTDVPERFFATDRRSYHYTEIVDNLFTDVDGVDIIKEIFEETPPVGIFGNVVNHRITMDVLNSLIGNELLPIPLAIGKEIVFNRDDEIYLFMLLNGSKQLKVFIVKAIEYTTPHPESYLLNQVLDILPKLARALCLRSIREFTPKLRLTIIPEHSLEQYSFVDKSSIGTLLVTRPKPVSHTNPDSDNEYTYDIYAWFDDKFQLIYVKYISLDTVLEELNYLPTLADMVKLSKILEEFNIDSENICIQGLIENNEDNVDLPVKLGPLSLESVLSTRPIEFCTLDKDSGGKTSLLKLAFCTTNPTNP